MCIRDSGNGLSPALTGEELAQSVPEISDLCELDVVPPVAMRRMRFMLVFLSYLPPQGRSRSAVLWHLSLIHISAFPLVTPVFLGTARFFTPH